MSSFVPHFAFGATIGVIAAGASIPLVDSPTVATIVTPLITGIMGALTPDMDVIVCYFWLSQNFSRGL